jgi:uncharacterized protein (UPF0216 family)
MELDELNGISKRVVNCSFALPMSLINVIDQIAHAESVVAAKVMARVIRKGLEVERAEREAKRA